MFIKKILKINFITVSILIFLLLLIFKYNKFLGYEGETYQAMMTFLLSGEIIGQRAGFISVLSHLPFAFLDIHTNINNVQYLSLPFYVALTGSMFYLLVKNLYKSRKIAFCMSFFLIFTTMFLPYSVIGMEHIFAFTVLSSFTFLFLYSKNSNKYNLLLSAVFAGLTIQTKAYGVLLLLPLGIYFLLILKEEEGQLILKRNIKKVTLFLTPIVFFVLLGFLYNYFQYGSIFSTKYDLSHELQPISLWVGLYGILFSAGKGLFIFNPLLIISAFMFKEFFKKHKKEFIFIVIFSAIFIPFNAGYSYWSDEVWGSRKLLVLIPFLLLPISLYFKNLNKIKIIAFAVVAFIGFYINFVGTIYDYGKQLTLYREMDLDSLEKMRYVPELSHISINSLLFKSYINKKINGNSLQFEYEEKSWMRNLAERENEVLSGGSFSLEDYDKPDISLLK